MTERQAACAVGPILLVADFPPGRNLLLAILAGVAVGITSWFWLDRR